MTISTTSHRLAELGSQRRVTNINSRWIAACRKTASHTWGRPSARSSSSSQTRINPATQDAVRDHVDHVLPFVAGERYPLLLKAVDFPCIKAGGGAIPDLVALHKPFIITEALPGPEPENAKFVKEQGIGWVAMEPSELIDTLTHLMNNPAEVSKVQAAQAPHFIDDSAAQIADIVADLGMKHFERRAANGAGRPRQRFTTSGI